MMLDHTISWVFTPSVLWTEYFQQLRTNKYPNQQSINFAIKNQVANLIKTTKQSLELSTIA